MKVKLKEVKFDTIKYTEHKTPVGIVINLEPTFDFQTPTVEIVEITTEYLTLKLLPSVACSIFYNKIHEFENVIGKKIENEYITCLFMDDQFKVKIKENNFKVFFESKQFNFYHLKPGMHIICLVSILKLWKNIYSVLNYNLKVNEILIKKVI